MIRTSYEERATDARHGHALTQLTITAVDGLPEIRPGDDLATLIRSAARAQRDEIQDGDIVVIAQKIVSKSEGRIVHLADVTPGARALEMAAESGKDARQIEVVLSESAKIVRWERGILICETHHGFVCANAGVDRSNAGAPDTVVLLPIDPEGIATDRRFPAPQGNAHQLALLLVIHVAAHFRWRSKRQVESENVLVGQTKFGNRQDHALALLERDVPHVEHKQVLALFGVTNLRSD